MCVCVCVRKRERAREREGERERGRKIRAISLIYLTLILLDIIYFFRGGSLYFLHLIFCRSYLITSYFFLSRRLFALTVSNPLSLHGTVRPSAFESAFILILLFPLRIKNQATDQRTGPEREFPLTQTQRVLYSPRAPGSNLSSCVRVHYCRVVSKR